MTNDFTTSARENRVGLWISVSFLWGTIFYISSIFVLHLTSEQLGGNFHPEFSDSLKSYLFYALLIVAVALGGYAANRLYDPTGVKRQKRISSVTAGLKEQVFVSFLGSLATSFVFCLMTALAFWGAHLTFGIAFDMPLRTILIGSLVNMLAGLLGSLLTGLVFLGLRLAGKFPTGEVVP
ncbi:MAG: hypothetical protein ACK42Y_08795 [Candidatus Thermochlorobacter sp.]